VFVPNISSITWGQLTEALFHIEQVIHQSELSHMWLRFSKAISCSISYQKQIQAAQ